MKKTLAFILSAALALTSAPVFAFDSGEELVSETAGSFGDGDFVPEPAEDIDGGQDSETDESVEVEAEFSSEPEDVNADLVLYEDSDVMIDETTHFMYRVLEDETSEVCGFDGVKSGDLNIPDQIAGHKVTGIGVGAFYGCKEFDGNLSLPSGLLYIADVAFCDCDGLVGELHLPESLTYIGSEAFSGCTGLSGNLILPNGLSEIGGGAFQNCSGVTGELRIPSKITNINHYTFYECTGFTSLILPDNLLSIENHAFYDCKFTGDLKLPKNLTNIGDYAFYNCKFRGDLEIPGNVTYIHEGAFYHCSNLKGKLILNEGIERIGVSAFDNCGFNGELILPYGLKRIDADAFSNCYHFTGDLVIPDTVNVIGAAFDQIYFTRIENQSSVAFRLPDISDNPHWYSLKSNSFISDIISGQETVVRAGNIIFDVGNYTTVRKGDTLQINAVIENLESENISFTWKALDYSGNVSPVASIDENGKLTALEEGEVIVTATAFDSIIGQITIIVSSSSQNYPTPPGQEEIITDPDTLFRYRKLDDGTVEVCGFDGVKSGDLIIPDKIAGHTVTGIGESAFEECHEFLGDLVLPSGLVYIKGSAFFECDGLLGELHLPENVTYIGSFAFGYCDGFSGKLILPSGLTEIDNSAFVACSGFTGKLEIPSQITNISDSAFQGCSGFSSLVLPENLVSIDDCAFRYCEFTGELKLPNSLTSIGWEAFYDCKFTGKLNLPYNLTDIGHHAFYSCRFTGDLEIPEKITTISEGTFQNCNILNGNLILHEGIKRIKADAFLDCGFSGKLNLPSGLLRIDENAFASCYNLTGELIIPETVKVIKGTAFYNTNFTRIINQSPVTFGLPNYSKWYSLNNHSLISDIVSEKETAVRADNIIFNVEDYATVKKGDTLQIKAMIENLENENISFTWKALDYSGDVSSVASIDNKGKLTALSEGEVIVTATAFDAITGQVIISVSNTSIPTTPPTVTPSTSPATTPSVTPSVRPSTTPALSPTVTPTAAPTGTPEATTTPTPSASPEPTGEPEPTLTPDPTQAPEPTQAPTITPGPVSTPEGITVEPTLGSKKVDLSWNPVPDADGYIILVKDEKTGEFKRIKTINDPNITSFSKTMGELGGLYTFKIQSFKKTENGPSVYEDLGGEIPVQLYEYNKAEKPEVKGTTKTGSKKVHFQWDKIDGADGYLIYKLNPATKQYELLEKIEGEDSISYDLSEGLGNGETYSFRVRSYAVSSDGEQVDGKISATIKVTTPPVKAKKPAAVSKEKNKAQISWPTVNNAKGYRIYRSTSKNGKYSSVKTVKGGNNLSFTDKNLKSGKVYFYKIRAYSENPDGSKSFGAMSAAKKVKVK